MSYAELGNCRKRIKIPPPVYYPSIEIRIEEKECENMSDPNVWGQAFWFINHLGSVNAPELVPTPQRSKYWNFIDGIPAMLPCSKCSEHAREYIDKKECEKDSITSSRENLIRFFTEFHNYVNQRTGKPLMTPEEVEKTFSGKARIQCFRFS